MKCSSLSSFLLSTMLIPNLTTCMKPDHVTLDTVPDELPFFNAESTSEPLPTAPVDIEEFKKLVKKEKDPEALTGLNRHISVFTKALYKEFKPKEMPNPTKATHTSIAVIAQLPLNMCAYVTKQATSDTPFKPSTLSAQCGYQILTKKDAFQVSPEGKVLKDPLHPSVLSLLPLEAQTKLISEKDAYLTAYYSSREWKSLRHQEKRVAGSIIFLRSHEILAPALQKYVILLKQHKQVLKKRQKKLGIDTFPDVLKMQRLSAIRENLRKLLEETHLAASTNK